MKAVVFQGPKKVAVQDVPIPQCKYMHAHNLINFQYTLHPRLVFSHPVPVSISTR